MVPPVFPAFFFVRQREKGSAMGTRGWKDRIGRAVLRQRMIAVLGAPENAGLSYARLAEKVGVGRWAFRRALTEAVRAEVEARLAGEVTPMRLREMDKAMLAAACKGNVVAARIVYARAAGLAEAVEPPSLEELERMVAELKGRKPKAGDTARGDDEV